MQETDILFVKTARELLESGDSFAAIDTCKQGIEKYPDYPLARAVLVEAYFLSGKIDEAANELNNSCYLFPFYRPLKNYRNVIEQTEIISSIGNELYNPEFESDGLINNLSPATDKDAHEKKVDENSESVEPENEEIDSPSFLKLVRFNENAESDNENESPFRASNRNIISGLNTTPLRPTKKTSAERNELNEPFFPEFYNPYAANESEITGTELYDFKEENKDAFATDTLASILESQGAYEQAIKVYRKLIEKNPEKEEFYNSKISEIQVKIR